MEIDEVGCAEHGEAHRLPWLLTRLMRFAALSTSYNPGSGQHFSMEIDEEAA
jgi:uncharacterized membrane protein YjgN (DUF898 family)